MTNGILISTPAYTGDVGVEYNQSQARLLSGSAGNRSRGIQSVGVQHKPCDGLIQRARAACLAEFMETGMGHLMQVDSDIGYDPDDIGRLHDACQFPEVDVVCGVYPKRQDQLSFPVQFFHPINNIPVHQVKGIGPMAEIKYAPGGFTMIPRRTIERMIAHYPERRCKLSNNPSWHSFENRLGYDLYPTPIDDDGNLLSEDYGFCKLLREIGGRVWAILDIRLGHKGAKVYKGCLADILYTRNKGEVRVVRNLDSVKIASGATEPAQEPVGATA